MEKLTTFPPLAKLRASGSLPRLPTRITLLTLPAMFDRSLLLAVWGSYKPSATAVQ